MKQILAAMLTLGFALAAPASAYWEEYTYPAERTITETYQVVVPRYDWVPASDWVRREQVVSTERTVIGRSGRTLAASEARDPATRQSVTFMSDRGKGNTGVGITGSALRRVTKADEAVGSRSKQAAFTRGTLPAATRSIGVPPLRRSDTRGRNEAPAERER